MPLVPKSFLFHENILKYRPLEKPPNLCFNRKNKVPRIHTFIDWKKKGKKKKQPILRDRLINLVVYRLA